MNMCRIYLNKSRAHVNAWACINAWVQAFTLRACKVNKAEETQKGLVYKCQVIKHLQKIHTQASIQINMVSQQVGFPKQNFQKVCIEMYHEQIISYTCNCKVSRSTKWFCTSNISVVFTYMCPNQQCQLNSYLYPCKQSGLNSGVFHIVLQMNSATSQLGIELKDTTAPMQQQYIMILNCTKITCTIVYNQNLTKINYNIIMYFMILKETSQVLYIVIFCVIPAIIQLHIHALLSRYPTILAIYIPSHL